MTLSKMLARAERQRKPGSHVPISKEQGTLRRVSKTTEKSRGEKMVESGELPELRQRVEKRAASTAAKGRGRPPIRQPRGLTNQPSSTERLPDSERCPPAGGLHITPRRSVNIPKVLYEDFKKQLYVFRI